jgi:hypothetical protein
MTVKLPFRRRAAARGRGGRQSGQTMIEYVAVLVLLMTVVWAMAFFLFALRLQSDRVLTLVASDYP